MTVAEFKLEPINNPESFDNPFVKKIREHQIFFHRTMDCFREEDSNFRPNDNMLTAAGQVLHVTMAIEFFLSGMFGPYDGFGPLSRRDRGFSDMGWTEIADNQELDLLLNADVWPKAIEASKSIAKALELFDQTMDTAAEMFGSMTLQQIETEQLPENLVFPPLYTYSDVLEIMNDHTAHHRGSLVVYARLLGRDPKIPYFEMSEKL